jgi:DNA-binding transcriptional MerR regulator
MLIGELCQKTDMTKDTIRFYEKVGLLSNVPRKDNGYKDYTQTHAEQLNLLKHAKELGFTLNEIKELARLLFSNKLTPSEMNTFLKNKEQQIDNKVKKLLDFKQRINDTIDGNCQYKEQLNKVVK